MVFIGGQNLTIGFCCWGNSVAVYSEVSFVPSSIASFYAITTTAGGIQQLIIFLITIPFFKKIVHRMFCFFLAVWEIYCRSLFALRIDFMAVDNFSESFLTVLWFVLKFPTFPPDSLRDWIDSGNFSIFLLQKIYINYNCSTVVLFGGHYIWIIK